MQDLVVHEGVIAALKQTAFAMAGMKTSSELFRSSILFLKRQGFKIPSCKSAEYHLFMGILKASFPYASHRVHLNYMSTLRGMLKDENFSEDARFCLTRTATKKRTRHEARKDVLIELAVSDEEQDDVRKDDEPEVAMSDEEKVDVDVGVDKEVSLMPPRPKPPQNQNPKPQSPNQRKMKMNGLPKKQSSNTKFLRLGTGVL